MINRLGITFILFLFIACDGNFLTGLDRSRITLPTEPIAQSLGVQLGVDSDGQWSTLQPAAFSERCSAMTADPEGNIYCAGHTGSELFDVNTTNSNDIFVLKMSSLGDILWGTQIGETNPQVVPGGDTTLADICVGMDYYNDAIYCSGQTRGSLGHIGGGGVECVVVKFDATTGGVEWIRQFTSVRCDGVGVNATGVYLGGRSSIAFAEAPGGSNDVVFIKLDHDGNDVWFRQLGAVTPVPGGSTSGNDSCVDITVDNADGIYCAGRSSGSLGESPGGSVDVIFVKYNSDGVLQWVTQLGADSYGAGAAGSDLCWSIEVSGNRVFCGGRTTGSLGDTNTGGPAGSNVDSLIIHVNATTGAVEWVHQGGESFSSALGDLSAVGSGVCDEVTADEDGNVYCGGRTLGDLFDSNSGNNDVMAFKLDSDGNFLWGSQLGVNNIVGDASQEESVYGMTVSNGQVYLGGDTQGDLFEGNAGSEDMFIFTLDVLGGML